MKAARTQRGARICPQIMVVDDHPMTRQGVAQRIRAEPDLAVGGEMAGATAALVAIRRKPPDLVLVDLSLGERSGLELIQELHALQPEVPVLVFSMHYESLFAERVLRAGARGYVMKSDGAEKLIQAIRHVLRGEVYLSAVMRDRAMHRFSGGPSAARGENAATLSDRELQVFERLGEGLNPRQIARRLKMANGAVTTHLSRLKAKLKAPNATGLAQAAAEWMTSRAK